MISDHAPLWMSLNMPTLGTEYRPWKFNTLFLSDEEFVQFISKEIDEYLLHNNAPGISSGLIWESFKAYLRGKIIAYCASAKRVQHERPRKIESDILPLDGALAHSFSPELFKQRLALQTEFNLITTKQIEGLLNKSRHKIYEHGEKI